MRERPDLLCVGDDKHRFFGWFFGYPTCCIEWYCIEWMARDPALSEAFGEWLDAAAEAELAGRPIPPRPPAPSLALRHNDAHQAALAAGEPPPPLMPSHPERGHLLCPACRVSPAPLPERPADRWSVGIYADDDIVIYGQHSAHRAAHA